MYREQIQEAINLDEKKDQEMKLSFHIRQIQEHHNQSINYHKKQIKYSNEWINHHKKGIFECNEQTKFLKQKILENKQKDNIN